MSEPETIQLGVELLEGVNDRQLSLAEAVDRLEAVTDDPRTTREILERAEAAGIISREDGQLTLAPTSTLRFDDEVVSREGDFSCRRCGASLSTGWFLVLESGDLGPFGSTCIRRVTGRD